METETRGSLKQRHSFLYSIIYGQAVAIRMFVQNKRLLLFSSVCTYLCFLGLILALKKPLCIDSMVVHKIDRVSVAQTESAYSCNLNRVVNYSSELEGYINKISPSVERTILLLNSMKPFRNKLQISVREDRPLMFEVNKNRINIGTQFINLDYHLSRALIKAWIFENKNNLKIDTSLFEESMTDFILFFATGRLELEDPVDKVRTKLGSVKWPQVIKTTKGYCTSAWKYAEHIESCESSQNNQITIDANEANQDAAAAIYSLRPLLTSSLIGSYSELKPKQRRDLIQNLDKIIFNMHLPSEKVIESMLVDANPLHNGIININKFTDLILSTTLKSRNEVYQFYTGITQQLQQFGVTDTFAEAYFDYVIEYTGRIDQNSAFYKALDSAAAKNSNVQIALKDSKNIWILPSKTALPISVFNQIQSRQTVFWGCDNNKNVQVSQFFRKTEKLMLINECDQTTTFDFEALFQDGVKGFIGKNHKIKFVQLHLPSIEMIQSELATSQNYFELVKSRDISQKEFKTLGWSQVQWKKDLQAYRPKAVIDAIEYFRN